MARISVRYAASFKISLAVCSCAVIFCSFFVTASRTEGKESNLPHENEKHWVSAVFDHFTSSTDALQWSDIRVLSNWRIQQHAQSESYRILNMNDKVVVEGTLDVCSRNFSNLIQNGDIDSLRNDAVILIHGLGESRSAMNPLVAFLDKNMSASIMTFGYASPQATLASHARALEKVLASLPPTTTVSFVGHSMGNLVVRRWLQIAQPEMINRIKRMVMLGPPNQGSDLARLAAHNHWLKTMASGAARELVLDWDTIRNDLQIPPFQYGIIAGGKGDNEGYSSILEGDDDAIVRVSETQLSGADGFLVIPVRHSRMMKNPDVQMETLNFLQTGQFAKKTNVTNLSEK